MSKLGGFNPVLYLIMAAVLMAVVVWDYRKSRD